MPVVSAALAEELGSAAAALERVGKQRGLSWELDRWLVQGRSGAIVGVVYETDVARRTSRTVLLKLEATPDDDTAPGPFSRHRDALRDAPDFADRHLVELASPGHDLIPVDDGRWIIFQKVAAVGADEIPLADLDVLTKALASVIDEDPADSGGRIACAPDQYVDVCVQVVRAVLDEWAGPPAVRMLTIADYLGCILGASIAPGRWLHDLSERLTTPTLRIGEDRDPLPNPFVALAAGQPGGQRKIAGLFGRSHADLHTGNILVPLSRLSVPTPFRLVDLGGYEREGPLARDPAGLLLFTAARALPSLSEEQQEALGHVLVDPTSAWEQWTPPWLGALSRRITEAGVGYAHRASFSLDVWRAQWQAALIGGALLLLSRRNTRPAERVWLLRLAARATRVLLDAPVAGHGGAPMVVRKEMLVRPPAGPPLVTRAQQWAARFCLWLPVIEAQAAHDPDVAAELADLRQAALTGADRTERFAELARRLGGAADGLRANESADPPRYAVRTCPLAEHRCGRVQPDDATSHHCGLRGTPMRHEFW